MNRVVKSGVYTNYKGNNIGCYTDMDNLQIINLATCVDPFQAANKFYVDQLFNTGSPTPPVGFSTISFTLNGTTPTNLFSTIGSYTLFIKSNTAGGPFASFQVLKNDTNVIASIYRVNSFCGNTTKERLNISWDANDFLKCSKDGINFDGNYSCMYSFF